jgi:hypothetical protein
MGDDEKHAVALQFLFKQILHAAVTTYPARAKAGADAEIEAYRNRAAMLRAEADDTELLRPGAGGVDWAQVAAGMRAKADVLDQLAGNLPNLRIIAANARGNLTGIQTASRISAIFLGLFGSAMPKQAAIVAEILTGERVTYEQVRHINKSAPGVVKFLRSAAPKPRISPQRKKSYQ